MGLLSLSFHSKSEWEETLTQSPVFKIYRGLSLHHDQNRGETLLWAVSGREGAGLRVSAILPGTELTQSYHCCWGIFAHAKLVFSFTTNF